MLKKLLVGSLLFFSGAGLGQRFLVIKYMSSAYIHTKAEPGHVND